MTSSMTTSTLALTDLVTYSWCIFTPCLMMIHSLVFDSSWKMSWFCLCMNKEGRLWCHTFTSSLAQSNESHIFLDNLHMVFPYLIPNWSYIAYFVILKTDEILRSWRTFPSKFTPEVEYVIQIARSLRIFPIIYPLTLKNNRVPWWRYVKLFVLCVIFHPDKQRNSQTKPFWQVTFKFHIMMHLDYRTDRYTTNGNFVAMRNSNRSTSYQLIQGLT